MSLRIIVAGFLLLIGFAAVVEAYPNITDMIVRGLLVTAALLLCKRL